MKKRNIFLVLVLSLALLVTACGKKNPFEGKWKGSCDITDLMVETLVTEDASLEEYIDFDTLELVLFFEFDDGKMTITPDEEGMETLVENLENGIVDMMDALVENLATENEIDVEDAYVMMQIDRDALIKQTLDELNAEEFAEGLAEAFSLSGIYSYDDEMITIIGEDNTYEEMKYDFHKKKLTITISDGEDGYDFLCERQK